LHETYSLIAKTLTRIIRKDVVFTWDAAWDAAFEALKQALTTAPVLVFYDPQLPTKLETDAADGVVAGMLFPVDRWGLAPYCLLLKDNVTS
jgi:hypothetical protein